MTMHVVEVILPAEGPALVLPAEQAYVSEHATGLTFREDTPLEVVGTIISRLTRQQKRIEWALGDAMNFAERRYGDTYAQWVDETNLSENTLATIKWVAGKIESSRRREDVGWSHHREVAGIGDPKVQDRLLDVAADKGMTRWEVRQAVKAEQEKARGRAVTPEGAPVEPSDDLSWRPTKDQLVDECRSRLEVRLSEMDRKHRTGFESGWLAAHVEADALGCFKRDGEES